jgi:Predicted transcriptional regulators
MAKNVPIDSVITERVLTVGDDLSDLAQSMKRDGLTVPLLVTQDYELIDGLRRLEAARALGWTEIEVVPTILFPRACELINQAREHGLHALPLTGQRIWEIYSDLKPLLSITRSMNQRGRAKAAGIRESSGGRPLLSKSLGLKSEALLQAITHVHRMLSDPTYGAKAAEALELIEAGHLSYYGAHDFIKKTHGLTGSITGLNEQRSGLEAAITSLNGTVRALNQLGPLHKKLPSEEASARLAEFHAARAKLTKFIRLLTEEINDR